MPIFEVSPQKVLKRIKKFAAEGSVGKVPTTVREEREKLLEDPVVSVELVAFLLDIGHPDLAAEMAEDVMRRHRNVTAQVRSMIVDRLPEFSRSTELMRVAWRSFIEKYDFRGALDVLSMGDKIAEARFMDEAEDRMKSALRFDGSIHPDANQSELISWSLCLFRKDRADEAVDFLWKVCRSLEFPHRGIPALAFWIGDRTESLDTAQWISLMGIAAVSNQIERALQYGSLLLESDLSPDSAVDASLVMEKWMVPVDGSGRSAAILAKMHTAAGRLDSATSVLEEIFPHTLDRDRLGDAIGELLDHPDSGAAALLLAARFALEKGDISSAEDSVRKAFDSGDADSVRLGEVSRSLIAETGDTSGDIAQRLATHLVENGDISEAVASLFPILGSDPQWVFGHVHKLVARDRTSASVLALLSAVLMETGKKQQALVALEHLSGRNDRRSFVEAAQVLDSLEAQVEAFPELREARALFRFRSDRRDDAASDWFKLLLGGVNPSAEGRNLLTGSGLRIGSVADLTDAEFTPRTPFQAFVAALIALRENEPELADDYLLMALDDPALHQRIVDRLAELEPGILVRLKLSSILPAAADGGAAATVASILGRLEGTEDWMLSLATELEWDEPAEETLFRLKYLLARDRIPLAGTSFREGTTDDPSVVAVALACRAMAEGRESEALEHLEKPVSRSWTSTMARKVLSGLLNHVPAEELKIRMLMARSYETDRDFPACAAALDPVLQEPDAMALLVEIYNRHPGEQALVSSLTTATAQAGDFQQFLRYSSVLLDLDPASAAGVGEASITIGREKSIGAALVNAARVSRKHSLGMEIDGILIEAIILDHSIADKDLSLEFDGLDPRVEALSALVSADPVKFAKISRERPELSLPVTMELVSPAIDRWDPAGSPEALTALADQVMSAGIENIGPALLASLSSGAPEPWSSMASRRLLHEVGAGRAARTLFWRSARDGEIISEALGTLLPDGRQDLDPQESAALASAILKSTRSLPELLDLSQDPVLFPQENTELAVELAAACENLLPLTEGSEPLGEVQEGLLAEVLIRGGAMSRATELSLRLGSNDLLSRLRDALAESRGISHPGEPRARALLLSGDPAGALSELENRVEKDTEPLDLMAQAQWDLGLRRLAISSWLREYTTSGDTRPLTRLLWALESAGAPLDRAALVRFISEKHPGSTAAAAGAIPGRGTHTGFELISGLRPGPIQKKVKNG